MLYWDSGGGPTVFKTNKQTMNYANLAAPPEGAHGLIGTSCSSLDFPTDGQMALNPSTVLSMMGKA